MSSYRKHRSRKSIYHPGISLSHPITYNQKKGMILQRDTNLPEPGHVYSRKELEKMYRTLLSFRMIPSGLTTDITTISATINANQLNEVLLSYSALKGDIAEAIGTSVGKIRQFQLQSITVSVSQGNYPKVSYKWVVGASNFSVSSGTNNLSGYSQYYVRLGTPIIRQSPYDISYVYAICPQVKNSTTSASVVSVQWDQQFSQYEGGAYTDVYDLWQDGVRSIPWALYDSNATEPLDVHTELSIDMTGNTNDGQLMLEFMVVYEE